MAIDLQTIDERLAKAKEEAEFWEKARAVLADPRLRAIEEDKLPPVFDARPTVSDRPQTSVTVPRAYGELKNRVFATLPEFNAGINERITTQQIVERLKQQGYVFVSKDPTIAVNGALAAFEEKKIAEWNGKRGNAKLWRKKRPQSPAEQVLEIKEALERAS